MDLSGTAAGGRRRHPRGVRCAVVGMNCGLGPEQMLPLVERMAAATALPLIVQPNAGLPHARRRRDGLPGHARRDGRSTRRASSTRARRSSGRCCGSLAVVHRRDRRLRERRARSRRATRPAGRGARGAARRRRASAPARPLAIIGERINPTGKKALAESLRAGSMTRRARRTRRSRQRAGADLLDVNVGAAGVDAADGAARGGAARSSALTDLPLVLDNTDPAALEAGAEASIPAARSSTRVNGGRGRSTRVLPLAARYGAAVVVLALDDDGIPATRRRPPRDRRARARGRARRRARPTTTSSSTASSMTAATDPSAVGHDARGRDPRVAARGASRPCSA